jgi:hypothetical protein
MSIICVAWHVDIHALNRPGIFAAGAANPLFIATIGRTGSGITNSDTDNWW